MNKNKEHAVVNQKKETSPLQQRQLSPPPLANKLPILYVDPDFDGKVERANTLDCDGLFGFKLWIKSDAELSDKNEEMDFELMDQKIGNPKSS